MDPRERGRQRSDRTRKALEAAYLATGRKWSHVFASDLAQRLEWSEPETLDAIQSMVDRGLAKYETMGPSISLTSVGMDRAEEELLQHGTVSDRALVQRRQAARLAFLQYAYDATQGRTDESFNFRDGAAATGIRDDDELAGIADWLVDRRLLSWYALGGSMLLTAEGIDEVEQAREVPDQPSAPGLAAVNVLVVTDSPGAIVQQGTVASAVTVTYNPVNLDDIRRWLGEFESRLDDLEFDSAVRAEVDATLAGAKAHASLAAPKTGILRASLEELKGFLLAAVASGAGQVAATLLLGSWPGSGG